MTLQFELPKVGSKVTVTVRSKENYIYATSEFIDIVLEGVVIPNHKLIRPNSFTMRVSCPNVPIREINLSSVVDIQFADGTTAKKGEVSTSTKTLEVQGSNGSKYIVIKEGNKVTCTCPGYTFRHTCKHLALIK